MSGNATMSVASAAGKGVAWPGTRSIHLVWKLLLVGFVCYLSTEVGFAHKFPPHNISPLWPTGAILFGILVVAPLRHWWAYAFAAYFYSAIKAGVNVPAFLFLSAALIEQFIAAAAVRRFAGGLRAFDTLRNLIVYLLGAVILGPFTAAFVGGFAGGGENYWFYWRVWLLSEALALLTLAPAILTFIAGVRSVGHASIPRGIEPWLIAGGLLAVSFRVFHWPTAGLGAIPALVYLPLPLLLWAAMRFGPVGANTGLLILAALSISGAVRGLGPFASGAAPDSVLSLQLFLVAVSVPVMFLATAIEERRAAEGRPRQVLEAAPNAMVMMTEEGEIALVNTAVEEVFGYDREELIGRSIDVLIPDRLAILPASHRETTFATSGTRALPERRELFGRRKDASEVPVEVGVTPIETSEGRFVLASILDITERKHAEHETQRHRAELAHVTRLSTMGELATSLAHELNQPLTAILSNVQAAQRYLSASPPNLTEVREILKDVVQDDNRASEVIQRLRALVRKETPALVALDVGDLLRDVVRLVHSDAILRHSRVSLDVAPGLRPVRGDRIQLQQVALNLLLNAFEAMRDCPTGKREVVVRVEPDGTGMVRVAVCDCGVGFSEDAVEKIFQPFYTTKPTGLGMGLSISRSIIESHGGQLRAENNPDQGATFSFTLPVGAET